MKGQRGREGAHEEMGESGRPLTPGCPHPNSPNHAPQGSSAPTPAMGPQGGDRGLVFNLQHLLGLGLLLREEGAWGRRPAICDLGPASSHLRAPTHLPQPRDPIRFPHGLG